MKNKKRDRSEYLREYQRKYRKENSKLCIERTKISYDKQPYIIYQATNIKNGESYIGCCKGYLSSRKATHNYEAKTKGGCKFQKAIIEFGFENFNWNVLQILETKNTKKARVIELEYIKSLQPEYNEKGKK